MNIRVPLLLLLAQFSVAAASVCVPTYAPDVEQPWTGFTIPAGQPKQIVSKTFDGQGNLETWRDWSFDGQTLNYRIYQLDGFKSKTTITANFEQGRFVSVKQEIILGGNYDLPRPPHDLKAAFDRISSADADVLKKDIKITYDQANRIISLSMVIPGSMRPVEYTARCQYLNNREVTETTTINGSTTEVKTSLNALGRPAQELLTSKDMRDLTTYSAQDNRGQIFFSTVLRNGSVGDSGTVWVNAAGQTVRTLTASGDMKFDTTWAYDSQGNWIERTFTEDDQMTKTLRTIVY